jgi:hypothetical protein
MEGMKVSTRRDSYKKHMANLKGGPFSQSRKDANHPKPCEKHAGMRETSIERVRCTNAKKGTMKRNVSRRMTRDPESITLNECTQVKLSARIKNLQHSQQNLLQRIKKRLHCHQNYSKDSSSSCCEPNNTSQEYSQKSKKACRH